MCSEGRLGLCEQREGTQCARQVEMSCHFLLCASTRVSRPRLFVFFLSPRQNNFWLFVELVAVRPAGQQLSKHRAARIALPGMRGSRLNLGCPQLTCIFISDSEVSDQLC